ncbi:PREDICTED: UPF0496 protein 4-like isoform X2 [Nelumbo nucifera]|nr:PREDICTED: UPF0496 protein 4-like isoform X2 [Nelumbo nucifera]DAD19013.1 TPA_asm: hypothetical protein HUJ06_020476 [Nelumbo nucifera]
MSRPHDGNSPFFPFGNPFRMIFPKGSYLSPRFLALLNSFEETLAERLKKLKPKDHGDILSLSWMSLAMQLLSETHTDIKTLVTDLQFPVSDWDDKWMDVYLDNSIKLLDICIAFSSELSRLNQGQLLLQCVLHVLDVSSTFPSKEQLMRAHSSISDWMQRIHLRSPKLENCAVILHELAESLHLPKIKNSAKGKVLMRAMYGVRIETIFVCSVFTAAFSGSAKPLVDLHVSDKFLWAEVFNELQGDVNGGISNLFSKEGITILKDLEAVETSVKHLYQMTSADGLTETDKLRNSVLDLAKCADGLSQGLDLLSKEVECYFQNVLTGRDAFLCNLRVGGTESEPQRQENSVEEQVVR